MNSQQKRDRTIAALITMGVTLLLLLFLFFGGLRPDKDALASASIPEITQDEEELFLDPELFNPGEENAINNDKAAPTQQGEPEPSETDNDRLVIPGESPKPAPLKEKLVSETKESDVKTTEPKATKEEKQKITSSMAKGFSGQNGQTDGKNNSSGSGGTGTGITGSVNGRTFLGCPKPDITINHKVTVKVNIVVDESGKVTSASASGGADASVRRACERAAMQAKWSAKKGASETRGTITFTITPKA